MGNCFESDTAFKINKSDFHTVSRQQRKSRWRFGNEDAAAANNNNAGGWTNGEFVIAAADPGGSSRPRTRNRSSLSKQPQLQQEQQQSTPAFGFDDHFSASSTTAVSSLPECAQGNGDNVNHLPSGVDQGLSNGSRPSSAVSRTSNSMSKSGRCASAGAQMAPRPGSALSSNANVSSSTFVALPRAVSGDELDATMPFMRQVQQPQQQPQPQLGSDATLAEFSSVRSCFTSTARGAAGAVGTRPGESAGSSPRNSFSATRSLDFASVLLPSALSQHQQQHQQQQQHRPSSTPLRASALQEHNNDNVGAFATSTSCTSPLSVWRTRVLMGDLLDNVLQHEQSVRVRIAAREEVARTAIVMPGPKKIVVVSSPASHFFSPREASSPFCTPRDDRPVSPTITASLRKKLRAEGKPPPLTKRNVALLSTGGDSCLVVIRGHVYAVDRLLGSMKLPAHCVEVLRKHAGGDCTEEFESVHGENSHRAVEMLKQVCLGPLVY